jgi:hypothetical protein
MVGASESGVSYTQSKVSVTLDRNKYPRVHTAESNVRGCRRQV